MNNASRMKTNFIIVLNDNQMSISENVGGMNQYLNSFRTSDAYLDLKDGVTNSLNRIPVVGERMVKRIRNAKSGIKQRSRERDIFLPSVIRRASMERDRLTLTPVFRCIIRKKRITRMCFPPSCAKWGSGSRRWLRLPQRWQTEPV